MADLRIEGLTVSYESPEGLSPVVDDVSLTIGPGERLGIAGESGSGKSTILFAILGLSPSSAHVAGSITWDGREVLDASERELYAIRGKQIGLVPQAAINSLNPVASIRRQIGEVVPVSGGGRRQRRRETDAEIARLLDAVGLPSTTADRYPHQLSGGMRQRVIIAMALAQRPQLLLADEPTTALDVIVQAEVLGLLSALCADRGISLMMVSHELAVLAGVTDRMVVMRNGRVIESGTAARLFRSAEHPYTKRLVEAARVSSTPAGVVDA